MKEVKYTNDTSSHRSGGGDIILKSILGSSIAKLTWQFWTKVLSVPEATRREASFSDIFVSCAAIAEPETTHYVFRYDCNCY